MPIIRGKDKNGPYYKFGESGHKYYYKVNHPSSRRIAKNKAKHQGIAIHSHENGGDLIPNYIIDKGALLFDAFLGDARGNLPPHVRNFIEKYQSLEILEMYVCRKPVKDIYINILNIISLGQFKKDLNKSYDKLFHLYTIFTFDTKHYYKMEKNLVEH